MIVAIIAAAGAGKRMGRTCNKVFLNLDGQPILAHSVSRIAECPEIDKIIVVAAPDEVLDITTLISKVRLGKAWQVVAGGSERQFSVMNALAVIPAEAKLILVHDGARPLIEPAAVASVIAAAKEHRAAGIAVPVKDTIKVADADGFAVDTPPRSKLWAIQTPQAFDASLLRQAYHAANAVGFVGTDDAGLVERLGVTVKMVHGSYENLKITTPEDLIIAETLLRKGRKTMRIGTGYDVHKLVEGRKLILGGVEIPHTHGLLGHSDADVLLHAIKDAMLGAAALGDIGRHFPDTDPQYKGASSMLLLAKVVDLLAQKGYKVNNVDATIIAEKPKLAPYIAQMNENIAQTLGTDIDCVNIKATTTEGLGFTGRREGIAAQAAVTIVSL